MTVNSNNTQIPQNASHTSSNSNNDNNNNSNGSSNNNNGNNGNNGINNNGVNSNNSNHMNTKIDDHNNFENPLMKSNITAPNHLSILKVICLCENHRNG